MRTLSVCLLLLGLSLVNIGEEVRYTEEVNKKKALISIMENEFQIKFARIVFLQMVLETGGFKSKVFRHNNNPFGMKESKRDYDLGTNLGHAKYPTIFEAFQDYAAWQKVWPRLQACQTEEDYLNYLNNLDGKGARYAEDLEYTNKLRRLRKKFFTK